jgi:hypothetical protein
MKASTSDKKKFWAKHVRSQEGSGLSKRRYCLEKGLGYSQFMYWLKQQPSQTTELVPTQTFIPFTLPPSSPIEIVLPRGIRVRISQLSPFEIANLVKELANESTP